MVASVDDAAAKLLAWSSESAPDRDCGAEGRRMNSYDASCE